MFYMVGQGRWIYMHVVFRIDTPLATWRIKSPVIVRMRRKPICCRRGTTASWLIKNISIDDPHTVTCCKGNKE